ncbi:MAG TPA: prepilin-type N-terminal cleavage/methylation domain-containing protein [Tepidisphaeraceae bacterium]|nr:prepilin-type N-terminal cleavage/methylation domain-containing protein [Tepidisphaeraceae bacterium]
MRIKRREAGVAAGRCCTARRAFTLVELLVVIGIIALLISLLLPALNKAKQEANLVECSANLRSIGQLCQVYAAENNGYLPYGHLNSPWGGPKGDVGAWNTPTWDWPDTLTRLSYKVAPGQAGFPAWSYPGQSWPASNEQNMAADFTKVFHDTDTSGTGYMTRVSDYMGNIRVLGCPDLTDATVIPIVGNPVSVPNWFNNYYEPIRPLGSFKRPSESMMVWCGPQNLSVGGPAGPNPELIGPLCDQIDDAAPFWNADGYGLFYPVPAQQGYNTNDYNSPIALGNDGADSSVSFTTLATAKIMNVLRRQNTDYYDQLGYDPLCAMRFRHLNNTTVNALFIDGHVEARALGTVRAKDISVDWYNPGLPPILGKNL